MPEQTPEPANCKTHRRESPAIACSECLEDSLAAVRIERSRADKAEASVIEWRTLGENCANALTVKGVQLASESARADRAEAKLRIAENTLEMVRNRFDDIGPGIDPDADENNTSPEDSIAHGLGLLWKIVGETLKAIREEKS